MPTDAERETLARLMSVAAQPGYEWGTDLLSDLTAMKAADRILAAGYVRLPSPKTPEWDAAVERLARAIEPDPFLVADPERVPVRALTAATAALHAPWEARTMTPEQIRQWADEVRNEREGDSAAETLDEVADDYETNLTRIAVLEAALAAVEAERDALRGGRLPKPPTT